MPINGIKLLAHRGAQITSAENTMEAFERSRAEAADGIECDLRITADGEPVLFHDADARRVTGCSRRIRDMNWEELRRLRVFGRHGVPHLKDALEFMAGWPSGEIYFDLHEDGRYLLEALVRAIASSGLWRRCLILDFYSKRRLLLHARSLDSRINLSVMPGGPWNIAPSARLAGVRSLCLGWSCPMTRALYKAAGLLYDVRSAVARTRAMGVSVTAGVANTPEDIRYVLAQGATGVWTDDLTLARRTLGRLNAPSNGPSPRSCPIDRPSGPESTGS